MSATYSNLDPLCSGGCGLRAVLRCSRCLGAGYCGNECQRIAWASHKGACKAAAALLAATGSTIENFFALHERIKRKAAAGSSSAQFILGSLFDKGTGVAIDKHEAIKWWLRASENGSTDAAFVLGRACEKGEGFEAVGGASTVVASIKWYTRAAVKGDTIAMCRLGYVHANKRDFGGMPEANKWWIRAAEAGNRDAQYVWGVCLRNGDELSEAVKWWTRAAQSGHSNAQLHLGHAYYNGAGVDVNRVEAVMWYKCAAEQDIMAAQFVLGRCFFSGTGVVADKAEAVKWWTRAAEAGDTSAAFRLAKCYEYGTGVAVDRDEAAKWYVVIEENASTAAAGGGGASVDNHSASSYPHLSSALPTQ